MTDDISQQQQKTLKQLKNLKDRRIKSVTRKLTRPEKNVVEQLYIVEPFTYEIRTKLFQDIRTKEDILKELHFAKKSGKKTICKRLNKKEKETLEKNAVYFRVSKYMIKLAC